MKTVSFVSVEAMTFLPSSGKSFILGRVDEAVSNELGLGELAGLTVANEADSLAYDVSEPTRQSDGLRCTELQTSHEKLKVN